MGSPGIGGLRFSGLPDMRRRDGTKHAAFAEVGKEAQSASEAERPLALTAEPEDTAQRKKGLSQRGSHRLWDSPAATAAFVPQVRFISIERRQNQLPYIDVALEIKKDRLLSRRYSLLIFHLRILGLRNYFFTILQKRNDVNCW